MCILGTPILFSPAITSIHFSVIAITLHPKPSIHFKKGVDFDRNNNLSLPYGISTLHWSNSGLLAKKSITHKIPPDIIHFDLNKYPYVLN